MNWDKFTTPDGLPGLRLRGQTAEEHDWLAGFEGRPVEVKRLDDVSIALMATQTPATQGEGSNVKTPVVATPAKLYDKMEYDDLITEAVRRGLDPYQEKGDSGQQAMSKTAIVKMLREHDRAKV